jgi:hypothetical protein
MYLVAKDVAAKLGISERSALILMRSGRMPGAHQHVTNGKWYIHQDDLLAYERMKRGLPRVAAPDANSKPRGLAPVIIPKLRAA